VPSRHVADQLAERGIPETRVAIQPFGVTLPASVGGCGRESRPPGPLRCLYIGQISHRKGVRVLLHAAQSSGNDRSSDLVGPLVSLEVLEHVPENASWHGRPSTTTSPSSCRACFVLPSIDDAYGLVVVVEAMACGLAVVVTDHAGASEVVTDRVDGLLVAARGRISSSRRSIASESARLGEESRIRIPGRTTAPPS
jgi:glycosyltransferase involved in cell wall biosynthesis